MSQNAYLLHKLNLNPETLELAQSITREATFKTKAGSGFDLRHRAPGLPAICAYIASQRLKTNELTRQTAQAASCLSKLDFDKAFQIIEAAIGGNRRTSPTKRRARCSEPVEELAQRGQTSQPAELVRRPYPETPTKRRKLEVSVVIPRQATTTTSTPLKSILRTSPRKSGTTSTPSRVKLNVSKSEPEALSDSDVDMDMGPLPSLNLTPRAQDESDDVSEGPDEEEGSDDDGIMDDDVASFLSTPKNSKTLRKAEPVTVRRFRPVYLDYKQWNTLDPRLRVMYAT